MDEARQLPLITSDGELVPLYVSRKVVAALEALQQTLRTDAKLYRRVELMLSRMQPLMNRGPLTEALAVLVGKDNSIP
jgi:hypothetical protein